METIRCPICLSRDAKKTECGLQDIYTIECSICSNFEVTRSFYPYLNDSHNFSVFERGNIAGWVHENRPSSIDMDLLTRLKKLSPPSMFQKAEKILYYIIKNNPIPGIDIEVPSTNNKMFDALKVVGWCSDTREILYILQNYLCEEKQFITSVRGPNSFHITPKGWSYHEQSIKMSSDSNIGFVAMWFNEAVENVYINGIAPAISDSGYKPFKIDLHEHNKDINDEIIANIRNCRFMVADFTGHRGGVYFEAGFTKGIGKEVIWLNKNSADSIKELHFDVNHNNFIFWDENNLDKLRTKLKNRILAVLGPGKANQQ